MLVIGAAIRRRRLELGFSQEGFAQKAGIERARYGRIERGEANLTLSKFIDLAKSLEVSPEALLRDLSGN